MPMGQALAAAFFPRSPTINGVFNEAVGVVSGGGFDNLYMVLGGGGRLTGHRRGVEVIVDRPVGYRATFFDGDIMVAKNPPEQPLVLVQGKTSTVRVEQART